MASRILALQLSFVCLPTVAAAQTVWNATAQLGIQAAIAAASPGDILVLTASGGRPDYAPFTLDKGLTIRGNGARIGHIAGTQNTTTITISVPPGQVAHLEGIDCTYSGVPMGTLGCKIVVQAGTVRFEQCQLRRGDSDALEISGSDVTVASCQVIAVGMSLAGGRGIAAANSRLTLRDCTIVGADSTCHWLFGCAMGPSAAKPAIDVAGCVLHAERLTVRGGNGGIAGPMGNGAPALQATNSTVWLADSTLTGGSSSAGSGGTALVNAGTVPVGLRSTQLIGGSPGGGSSSGATDPTAPLVRLVLSPPWSRGATSTLALAGDPNAAYSLWLAPDASASVLSPVVEPLWLLTGFPILFGLLDPAGQATVPLAVPNVASLQHAAVWFQAVSGLQIPLRATTMAGGVIR